MKIPVFVKKNNETLPRELADRLNNDKDVWSNEACYGYCIQAIEATGLSFTREQMREILHQLHEAFDYMSVEEAEQKYREW